ncbi:hypothetical protein [Burkholderia vietnamiensis]|uniref:hypothetical protein n=1 Tax=Burkholderia vietnamiensis TaxID=60552 RepID=UPI00264B257A|nr:hypothetical protein [Burkholderia vietnamiensis]MDN7668331.1 hypothetical protein [Burkholderia vietnamiensis]
MTISDQRKELSERLRQLIGALIPVSRRFETLENMSDIAASKWKNFYYRKQAATDEMVNFWCKKYPDDQPFLTTGDMTDAELWLAPTPTKWEGQTIGDRLIWAIRQFTTISGASTFRYLEQRSKGQVTADEWANLLLKVSEPTAEMVKVIGEARPEFIEWIILGYVTKEPKIDPTTKEGVEIARRKELGPNTELKRHSIKTGQTKTVPAPINTPTDDQS